MDTVARKDVFEIFFVFWVVLGVTSGAFFYFSKNAPLKRKIWPPFVIGSATLFTAFAWYMSGESTGFAYIGIPMIVLITALNIRNVRFCDSCGKTIHNTNPFSPAKFCPKCGAGLNK